MENNTSDRSDFEIEKGRGRAIMRVNHKTKLRCYRRFQEELFWQQWNIVRGRLLIYRRHPENYTFTNGKRDLIHKTKIIWPPLTNTCAILQLNNKHKRCNERTDYSSRLRKCNTFQRYFLIFCNYLNTGSIQIDIIVFGILNLPNALNFPYLFENRFRRLQYDFIFKSLIHNLITSGRGGGWSAEINSCPFVRHEF